MIENPILVIGSIHGNTLERVETARMLGFEPVGVQIEGHVGHDSMKCFQARQLPKYLQGAPCILGGSRVYLDLANSRIDRKWIEGISRSVRDAESLGFTNWFTLVHPSANLSASSSLGRGSFVGPLANVSSKTNIGEFVSVGRSSSIGHDVEIGDFCLIGPNAAIPGNVLIGDRCLIGPAATLLNGIRVSPGSLIGAGSVVTRNTRNGGEVMGNPARPLRRPISIIRRALRRFLIRILRASGLYDSARSAYRRLRS